jgi:Peptidase family M28/PDZ domain
MKYVFLLGCLLLCQIGNAQEISEKNLRQHIGTLASDQFEGRGTGYRGEARSAKYIQKYFKKLKLQPKGDNGTWLQSFTVKNTATHNPNVDTTTRTAKNVVGYLDNGAAHTIIIGAHYDHLGFGRDGNSLEPEPAGKIHNGADDNASGVAGVLELAHYYATNGVKEKHNFLFICFSAEELGLLGSKYYTEHPTIDLTKANFMVNMDMIGRLSPAKNLTVGGVGTSPALGPLVQLAPGNLKIGIDSSGTGASDHTSFYLKNLPVLFFFTGVHTDYHKTIDDTDRINFEGEAEVLAYIARVVDAADAQPKMAFTPTRSNLQMSASTRMKVTMGVMPSYAVDGKGLKLDGVTEGKPAKKAGIQAGDIIQAIGEHPITDIQSYMTALGKFNKGEETKVKVLRGTEVLVLTVVF